jgi:predicted nucleotidyltransferase
LPYLYGSAVSGKSRADSDVDIALFTEPYKDQIESCKARVRYQVEISRLIEKDVDLVFLQEAGELLSFEILKRGEVIFERDGDAHPSFKASRLIQCLDFQFPARLMQKGMIVAMRRESGGK